MNKKIVVANWKMNPSSAEEAVVVARETVIAAGKFSSRVETIICPPFLYLKLLSSKIGSMGLGAQNCSYEQTGALTGEVSPTMIFDIGAKYVILGHSERRNMGETDELVAMKVAAAAKSGLGIILCVGEKERDPDGFYLSALSAQLEGSLAKLPKKYLKKLTVAYEPVWAIGKGALRAAYPSDVLEATIYLKKILWKMYGEKPASAIPILYGGSVDAKNAADFIVSGGADGLLVGRESLRIKTFGNITREVAEASKN